MDNNEKTGARASWARVLLVLPFLAVLWVPLYNSVEPTILGVPFFYTWQMIWVLLCSVIIGIIYRLEH
jgi:Protein of unknown function (DUF3311)